MSALEGEGVGPVSHQRGKQVVDQVSGRRRRGAGQGPGDLVRGQGEAFTEREKDVVEKPDWFTGEEMIEEGPVQFRRCGGTRKLQESGGKTPDG